MKPIERRKSIVSSGMDAFETTAFTIDVNSKSFRILIDKLYTDKIAAVIRELSTNALDSHVQAGKADIPFAVTLPTAKNPMFCVRDFGTSLSHKDCTNLYTTLFRSTNENTNETMGQLGLGSKSPFAYASSFTVDAFMDGRCRTYFASLADGGIPTISLLSDVESDEPTGFKVSVPVQEKDCFDFQEKAKRIYVGFDVKPDGVEVEIPKPLMTGDFWRVYERSEPDQYNNRNRGPSFFSGHLYVRQGSVLYPVSIEDVRSFLNTDNYPNSKKELVPTEPQTEFDSNEKFTYENRDYLRIPEKDIRRRNSLSLMAERSSIVIDVPIGAVEVAPSREALSMDEFTREFVRAAYLEAVGEIGRQIRSDVVKITNLYDASVFLMNIASFVQVRNQFFGWTFLPYGQQHYSYRGFQPKQLCHFELDDIPSLQKVYCGYDTKHSVTLTELQQQSSGYGRRQRPKVLIVRTDRLMLRRKLRIRRYLSAGVAYNTFVMENPSNKDLEKITRRLRLTNDDFIQDYNLKDYPPEPKPVLTEEQAKIAKEKSTRGVYLIRTDSTIDNPSSISDNHLWVAFVNGSNKCHNIGPTGTEFRRHIVTRFFYSLYDGSHNDTYVGGPFTYLYGVGPSRIDDFDPEKNAYTAMRELIETFDWANIRRSHAFYDAFDSAYNWDTLRSLYEHMFGCGMQMMNERLSNYFDPNANRYFATDEKAFYSLLYDVQPNAKRGDAELAMMEELREKYPLLFARSAASMETIKEYTELVDKKRGQ